MTVLLIGVGLALLAISGDRLVDFAVALALRARLTPAVVGLTIVAAGTSAPELFVSLTAAVEGSPDIALANVVGSNIANVGLILGLCALVAPLPVAPPLLKLEYPFMVLASACVLLLGRDGTLDRVEGGFLLASMAVFMAYAVKRARGQAIAPQLLPALTARPTPVLVGGILASFVGLSLGARLLVSGAVEGARALGVSDRVVGLTVVAIGTSLPELVASLAAAAKRHHDMAVTNLVGSNLFNLLAILGTTALVRPIPVAAEVVDPDMIVMGLVALMLFPLVALNRTLTRTGGGLLVFAYATYMGLVVAGR